MLSAFCKTSRQRESAASSVAPLLVVGNPMKVQGAVLSPSFVETRPGDVSMLTFVRPRNVPKLEEVPATYRDFLLSREAQQSSAC
jgi:hypothetical protein